MRISEITTRPLRAGAALRDKRFFHPVGVGTVEFTLQQVIGVPQQPQGPRRRTGP